MTGSESIVCVSKSILVLSLAAIGCAGGPSSIDQPKPVSLLDLPLSFESNRGQAGASVKFVSHGLASAGYSLFLTDDSAVFATGDARNGAIRMKLAGARSARISGTEALPGKVNYFLGNDPQKWISGASTYRKVDYKQVYKGIDLVYYGTQGQLEYDFVVAPGADPGQISLEFSGSKVRIGSDGELQLALNGTPLTLRKPVVYQTIGGKRVPVTGAYKLRGNRVQFALGAYDHSRTLVIDPTVVYLTYFGGSGGAVFIGYSPTQCGQCTALNAAQGVAVDSAGNLYITGTTAPPSVPIANAYQSTTNLANPNGYTVFVAKINPTASALVYSTYLGGSLEQRGSAIAVDSSGAAYVTGETHSTDFPVTAGAYQRLCAPSNRGPNGTVIPSCGDFSENAFLTKLAPGGGSLVYSTFLGGGRGADAANAVAVDSQGRAYVAGTSLDMCDPGQGQNALFCFPETANALLPQSLYNRAFSPKASNPAAAFVAVFDAAGANLVYSTLFGDKNPSNNVNNTGVYGTGVAVDPSGNFYLTGLGQDPAIPTTPNAFQPTGTNLQTNGGQVFRGFVAKFGPVTGVATGAPFIYGTYLGGTSLSECCGSDQVSGIAADAAGNAYITGLTQSQDFPVTPGANNATSCTSVLPNSSCENIGFLTKLNPSGTGLVWSTFVGGPFPGGGGNGTTYEIGAPRVDTNGNVYVTGRGAYNYPVVNPIQAAAQDDHGGVFVTKYDPTGSTILFSTVIYSVLGTAYHGGIDVDSQGNIYVGGQTDSNDIPVTSGVFEPVCNACVQRAGFLAKINPNAPGIALVANAFTDNPPIAPNTWVEIKGSLLSPAGDSRIWQGSDFANNQLPQQLDGVSVMVNGKAAYVYYISPTQVNILTPPDAMSGPVQVLLTNNGLVSNSFPVQAAAQALSFFDFVSATGSHYVYGRHLSDNSLIGPPSLFPGLTTPVKPGETIYVAGTGFGPTNSPIVSGALMQSGTLPQPWPAVTIGGVSATVTFAGLVGVGTYQFNIQVPSNVPDGDLPLTAAYSGQNTQSQLLITVQH